MRQHLALACALGLALPAHADRTAKPAPAPAAKPTPKPRTIDAKSVADQLEVYRDDTGMVLVTPKLDAFTGDTGAWVFYGDGKTMYQQRIVAQSQINGKREWLVWSPRVRGLQNADIEQDTTGVVIRCKTGADGHQHLAAVPPDQAKAILGKATFLPPTWDRTPRLLARDDDGVYFYVDQLREDLGGKDIHVYSGKKGAMKALSMTNVVSDSAGEIYATRTGELRIVAGKDGKAYWTRGGKKTDLTTLPPLDNRYLIYRELGIYGALGVVCDNN